MQALNGGLPLLYPISRFASLQSRTSYPRGSLSLCRGFNQSFIGRNLRQGDVDRYGIDRVAEYALEIAWKQVKCVFLSFDIDCLDPAFAPGTDTPEPGGFLPREVFKLLQLIAREGLAGIEVVEVSPPYDVTDMTALLASRVIMDVLGTLVLNRKLGTPAWLTYLPFYRQFSILTE
ncbi:MAG TPA: arginase family protein [Ktedonobacteraceae bacterium]|nr:arginase family protein [Ktedonobacteraceae bacterium]